MDGGGGPITAASLPARHLHCQHGPHRAIKLQALLPLEELFVRELCDPGDMLCPETVPASTAAPSKPPSRCFSTSPPPRLNWILQLYPLAVLQAGPGKKRLRSEPRSPISNQQIINSGPPIVLILLVRLFQPDLLRTVKPWYVQ